MNIKESFKYTMSAFLEGLGDSLKDRHAIATVVIQDTSPYLFKKISDFFDHCGFKKAEDVRNTWIFKSYIKITTINHYQYLTENIEKELETLCSFEKTEFPIKGLIQVSGDRQGHYYFSISCDAEEGPKLDISPAEY